jgi:hypothetical protein
MGQISHFVKYIIANIFVKNFNLRTKSTLVGGQLGGSF